MENTLKKLIIFVLLFLFNASASALTTPALTTPDLFNSLEGQAKAAQTDIIDLFDQLREMNIIPENFKLQSNVLSKNGKTLLDLVEFIQQNPNLSAEKMDFLNTFLQKLELLNYIELRKFIGNLKSNEDIASKHDAPIMLTESQKAAALKTLHEMFTFQVPNSASKEAHPFSASISQILLYISFINNSKFTYTQKKDLLALYLDTIFQNILKLKAQNQSCTIKNEEIEALACMLKSYGITKSNLKRNLIIAAKIALKIAIIAAIILTVVIIIKRYIAPYANQKAIKEFFQIDKDIPLVQGLIQQIVTGVFGGMPAGDLLSGTLKNRVLNNVLGWFGYSTDSSATTPSASAASGRSPSAAATAVSSNALTPDQQKTSDTLTLLQ